MNVPTKLTAFAALLALAFAGAALAGAAIDPTDSEETDMSPHATEEPQAHAETGHDNAAPPEHDGGHASAGAGEPAAGGLAVSHSGYTLEPERTRFEPGQPTRLGFRITDAEGGVVRDEFESEHERELHLIVVSRDTAVYQHLHPHQDADGTWSVQLELPEPGVYRAYADFQIAGAGHTLATDLFVPGDFRPRPLPEPGDTDEAGGYEVELRGDAGTAGREGELTFAVTRGGRPVTDLQDYLGAKGHLVALREGDLAYLHVHPIDNDGEPSEIRFAATFPTAGRYRLFLQFKTDGKIRTVAYTVEVSR